MANDKPLGLTFAIYPDAESVSVVLFLKSIEDISRMIRDVDYAVTQERSPRRWIIAALHSSVPTVTVRPIIDNSEVMDVIIDGLGIITAGTDAPPDHFTEQVLDDLKRMRRLFRGRDRAKRLVCSLDGRETTLQEDIGDKADRILKGGYWNLGSIEGTLEAVNLHGTHPTFTIWDRVSRAPVRCAFPKDPAWKQRVKESLDTRVLVRGRINYFPNGVPRSITDIKDLEDMTPDPKLPKASFGSIPSPDAAEDIAKFLKAVRGGRS